MEADMGISNWPAHQRPRERLIREGAQALSDAELLAVFLRVGMRGKNAVELAGDLLRHFGSLQALLRASLKDFTDVPGLGPAKYAQLNAVIELARRAISDEMLSGESICSPQAAKQYLRLAMAGRPYESFHVLFLDVRNRLIAARELFRGTLTHTSVYPREVVREALSRNAASVMLAHNHPSGTPEPSEADLLLTRSLVQALALVDIRILDHFVVAGHRVHSFAENGQM
jgi:DNA repair protein RadC